MTILIHKTKYGYYVDLYKNKQCIYSLTRATYIEAEKTRQAILNVLKSLK